MRSISGEIGSSLKHNFLAARTKDGANEIKYVSLHPFDFQSVSRSMSGSRSSEV